MLRDVGGLMKTYAGTRTIDGLLVTVDGAPLATRQDVRKFSDAGFEWGYVGAAPQQLALAILYDHLGNPDAALSASENFMKKAVSIFDNEWTMSTDEVQSVLAKEAGS